LAIPGSKCSCFSRVRAISRGALMIDSSIYPASIIGKLAVNRCEKSLYSPGVTLISLRRNGVE
ncbi:TPA: hypothetical protein ACX3LP_005126, partial [Raoultella ornithinolytica]